MNEEAKIKSFEEYYEYYEGSGILSILEDVYYTDYINAIKYFALVPIYEKLIKKEIKLKSQIQDRNKKLENCRSQLGQYVLNNQELNKQLQAYKDKEDKLREAILKDKNRNIKCYYGELDNFLQILNEGSDK